MEQKRERWEWEVDENGYKGLASGANYILYPESELSDYGLSSREWCDVSDEHARMIAAVPELLDLCYKVASLNRDAGEIGAGMLAQIVDQAHAAIAKATQP